MQHDKWNCYLNYGKIHRVEYLFAIIWHINQSMFIFLMVTIDTHHIYLVSSDFQT